MSSTDSYVIRTNNLGKQYGQVHSLRGLNLDVPRHSIFGFLGPNGAGKTTTIKLLLNLIHPTSGDGSILGYDIVRNSTEIRSRVGYLPQEPRFYDHMTAREILAFTARFFFKGPKKAIDARIDEVIDLVGLGGKADRQVNGFSGGEKQRLGLAQAAIHYPDLLILDEPAAALDPQGRRDVLDIMAQLKGQTTIFFCTHILDDVQRVADRVAILKQGELVVQAPIGELLNGGGSSIVYEVRLKGDVDSVYNRLQSEPWVNNVESYNGGDEYTWRVSVAEKDIAEERLLRLVLTDDRVRVLEFKPQIYELEDVFLNIVEGGQ